MPQEIETDIELATYFSSAVAGAYREGVEFMTALPSHALVRFRDALEFLCNELALQGERNFSPANLYELIDSLLDARVITFALKDRLHSIRKACNIGAHRVAIVSTEKGHEDERSGQEMLIVNAQSARDGLVEVMQRLYQVQTGQERAFDVKKEVIDVQEWKSLVFLASVDEVPESKYKAGLWCEAQAEKMSCAVTTVIVSDEFDVQYKFLKRLAATFHQAAYRLSPNLDAMFRYASLVEQGYLDGDKREEAVELIRKAADQGHGQACDHYGAILYEERQDYRKAEKYWMKALEKGCARAHYCLGLLYKSGNLDKPELDKAISFLERGVDEGDRDSMSLLGQCYFEGVGVSQSVEKARELLTEAANLGNSLARNYLILKVNGGEELVLSEMQRIGVMIEMMGRKQQVIGQGKIRVNDRCPCGSGKKYKKCCGACG